MDDRQRRIARATTEVARVLERHYPRATAQNIVEVCEVCVNVMATLISVATRGAQDATYIDGVTRMFTDVLAHRRRGADRG